MIRNKKDTEDARLIIAPPVHDLNILWATGFSAPDLVVYMEVRGKKYFILRELEVDRARKNKRISKVFSFAELLSTLKKKSALQRKKPRSTAPGYVEMVDHLFRSWGVRTVAVPENFGVSYADRLRVLNYKIIPRAEPFY